MFDNLLDWDAIQERWQIMMLGLGVIFLLVISLVTTSLQQDQGVEVVASGCTKVGCLRFSDNAAQIDDDRTAFLNLIFTSLTSEDVLLEQREWEELSRTSVPLADLLNELEKMAAVSSADLALEAKLPVSRLLDAYSLAHRRTQATSLGKEIDEVEELGAFITLKEQLPLSESVSLGDFFTFEQAEQGYDKVLINFMDLVAGTLMQFNYVHVNAAPEPIEVDSSFLNLTENYESLTLQAIVIEPPIMNCGAVGTTFESAAIRTKMVVNGLEIVQDVQFSETPSDTSSVQDDSEGDDISGDENIVDNNEENQEEEGIDGNDQSGEVEGEDVVESGGDENSDDENLGFLQQLFQQDPRMAYAAARPDVKHYAEELSSLNGTISGGVQLVETKDFTLNSGGVLDTLVIAGNPEITINSGGEVVEQLDGGGDDSDDSHKVTLNDVLNKLVVAVDAFELPKPPDPKDDYGDEKYNIDKEDESVEDWSDVEEFKLSKDGPDNFVIPAGTYKKIDIKDKTIILGESGQLSEYHIEELSLNDNSIVQIDGPTVLFLKKNLKTAASINAGGSVDDLTIWISSGDFSLNSGGEFAGHLITEKGKKSTINGKFTGSIISGKIDVNSGGALIGEGDTVLTGSMSIENWPLTYETVDDSTDDADDGGDVDDSNDDEDNDEGGGGGPVDRPSLRNVEVEVTTLPIYADIQRAVGTIDMVDFLKQSINAQARPGEVDLYIGDIEDITFFNRRVVLDLNQHVEPFSIGTATLVDDLGIPNTFGLKAKSQGESGLPTAKPLVFSGVFPSVQAVDLDETGLAATIASLLSQMQYSVELLDEQTVTKAQAELFLPAVKTSLEDILSKPLREVIDQGTNQALSPFGTGVGVATVTAFGVEEICTIDLETQIQFEKSRLNIGDDLVASISLNNLSKAETSTVKVQVSFPQELEVDDDTPSVGDFDKNTGLWEVPTVSAESSVTLEVVFDVEGDPGDVFEVVSDILVAESKDPDESNDRDSKNIIINSMPIANDDSLEAAAGATFSLDILANDTDSDRDKLVILEIDDSSRKGGVITVDDAGTPDDSADDYVIYKAPSEIGKDTFSYSVSDGFEGEDSAIVTIQIGEDTDRDTIPDFTEGDGDLDGDGVKNSSDIDSDNDGILDRDEGTQDIDLDGLPNYKDLDSDGDGIFDIIEAAGNDNNNDGVVDSFGDVNGDGLSDVFDKFIDGEPLEVPDTFGDGIKDFLDPDDDDDGVLTRFEDTDRNGDPRNDDDDDDDIPNYLDQDDDNDGIPSIQEDVDGNQDPGNDDTDGDGIYNYLDDDDDSDGILTIDEDLDDDGNPSNDDIDVDGVPNYLESNSSDSDGDSLMDHFDADDDGDGISTAAEDANGDGNPLNDDADKDKTPNYLDTDSDNDGVLDIQDGLQDRDDDGIEDYIDVDAPDKDLFEPDPNILIPQNVSVVVNGGDSCTTSREVMIRLTGDHIDEFEISNSRQFSGARWIPIDSDSLDFEWQLNDLAGDRSVYVKFRNDTGVITEIYSDTITYDNVNSCEDAEFDNDTSAAGDNEVFICDILTDSLSIGGEEEIKDKTICLTELPATLSIAGEAELENVTILIGNTLNDVSTPGSIRLVGEAELVNVRLIGSAAIDCRGEVDFQANTDLFYPTSQDVRGECELRFSNTSNTDQTLENICDSSVGNSQTLDLRLVELPAKLVDGATLGECDGGGGDPPAGDGSCPFACELFTYDFYIKGSDGVERHSNSEYARIVPQSDRTTRIFFEDFEDPLSGDFNDIILEINDSVCGVLDVKVLTVNAILSHEVRVNLVYDQIEKDLELWNDSHIAEGQSMAIRSLKDELNICSDEQYVLSTSNVFKGPHSTLFYLGSDGFRYTFENEEAFLTWFSDFSEVKTFPQLFIHELFLGPVIGYRPGYVLLKSEDRPTYYSINEKGVLIPMSNEILAVDIYGPEWGNLVIEIPEWLFRIYPKGDPIYSANSYNLDEVRQKTSTLELYIQELNSQTIRF